MNTDIKCILWDFGDTLVDERWMRTPPAAFPEWSAVWPAVLGNGLADQWDLGRVTTLDVVRAVAAELNMPVNAALAHARGCCEQIRFFEQVYQFSRRTTLAQGIVTVNPDLFSDWVVPYYRLDTHFFPIVTSWEEGTIDKGELGLIALERLNPGIQPSEALLIDNKRVNCLAWEAQGGRSYHFLGEAQFMDDLDSGLIDLR